jgi:hypothetical protein
MAQPLSFRWDPEFVARIDRARKTPLGEVSRSAFVRDAVELAIRRAEQVEALARETPEQFALRQQEEQR